MYIDKNICVGCGACARACPMAVIKPGESGKAEVRRPERCIRCFHCTAACPLRAVHIDGDGDYPPAPENALQRLIASRRSVRHFSEKTPERELVKKALDMAMYAPSGKNIHENRWSVLWGREMTGRALELVLDWSRATGTYPELLKNAARGIDLVTCGAPCVLVGHSRPDTLNPMLDTAIATATAELLLVDAGLATCWGGYLRRAINGWPELKAFCRIPEEREAYSILMVGYPDRERYPNIPPRAQAGVDWIDG